MSVNKVLLIGRLGQEPELKYTPSGAAVCNFSLATSESWTDKSGQKQEKTEWHRIVVWGKLAELCNQYLKKGSQAFVEGKLATRSWDAEDGTKRYATEINANAVQFLGGNPASTGETRQASTGAGVRPNTQAQPPVGKHPATQEYDVSNDANFTSDDIPF